MALHIKDVCNGCHSFSYSLNEPCCSYGALAMKANSIIPNDLLQNLCPCSNCIVKLQCDTFCKVYNDKFFAYFLMDAAGTNKKRARP